METITEFHVYAQVAQSVEQGTENPRVGGSIPPLGIFFCLFYDGLAILAGLFLFVGNGFRLALCLILFVDNIICCALGFRFIFLCIFVPLLSRIIFDY